MKNDAVVFSLKDKHVAFSRTFLSTVVLLFHLCITHQN